MNFLGRSILWLGLTILGAAGALADPPSASLPYRVEYVPPPVGTTYSMKLEYFRVASVDGDGFLAEDRWKRKVPWAAGLFQDVTPTDPHAVRAIWPLEIGKMASFDEAVDGDLRHHAVEIVNAETLETPDAIFPTLVIRDRVRSPSGLDVTITEWYAPAARAVIKRTVRQSAGPLYRLSDLSLRMITPSGAVLPQIVESAGWQPLYPAISKRLGEIGDVLLRFHVAADGRLLGASVVNSSGYPRLDQAALASYSQSLFKPGTLNGVPTDMTYVMLYRFRLADDMQAIRQREIIADFDKSTADEARPYLFRAQKYEDSQAYGQALADNALLISKYPENAGLYLIRSLQYIQIKDFHAAIDSVDTAIKLRPSFVFYGDRGNIDGRIGQFDQAITDFSKAIELNDSYYPSYIGRALAEYRSSRFDAAAKDFDKGWALGGHLLIHAIWATIARRHAGQDDRIAFGERAEHSGPDSTHWPIAAALLGQLSVTDAAIVTQDLCDVPFFLGEYAWSDGDRRAAARELDNAATGCANGPPAFVDLVQAERARLAKG